MSRYKGIRLEGKTTSNTYSTPSYFFELLTVLFIGLKLGGVIGWSWWWVLAPLWIPAAVALAFILFILLIVALKS